ncbi:amidase family protein [Ilumatobacter nonamiensis]|uniref:amidase family protein n=1 Tax=Ilumatobacter nonamiensis TaxID=467093 RepID=UPI00034A2C40|nr:amidase family protein [Ilumatobacter nonamiensis]
MSEIGVYSTATQMLAALDARTISSRELVELHLDRIASIDGDLNAVPVPTAERARAAASAADEARSAGATGPLLGLPMTLKESTRVAGLPQSAGVPGLAEHVPDTDGPIARAVLDAGACVLGKTNIPFALTDWQADSEVYGRTNNPWDLDRSPGGSTGGGGAALAAGMTPLEIGSDIGGSIRVPAAYCGVYGHRPSETAVPREGAFPMSDHHNPGVVMPVQGPLARSADDLELLFDVVAGPPTGEEGWRLHLPASRHDRISDFRVAVMPLDLLTRPSDAMGGAVDELARFLGEAGATVSTAMPEIDVETYYHDYLTTLMLMTTRGMTAEAREASAATMIDTGDPDAIARARGLTLSGADYLAVLDRRERARVEWAEFFRHWDVVICPTILGSAHPHQTGRFESRTLDIDGREVPYGDNVTFPMWAIFAGLPATAFPAGPDSAGLPLGLQAMGPNLEDRTTLRFAQLLEREWRGFEPPPAFAVS